MSELKELLVSGQGLDEGLLASVLKPLVRIDQETGAIRPQAGWRTASNHAKVVAYLLARKAMVALGMNLPQEPAAPKEIIAATGLPPGSVYPTLKALYDGRPQIVDKEGRSGYWIPPWGVDLACELLKRQAGG